MDERQTSKTPLEAAGWVMKERGGKRIWQHPRTGDWYSEEVALHIERTGMKIPGRE